MFLVSSRAGNPSTMK